MADCYFSKWSARYFAQWAKNVLAIMSLTALSTILQNEQSVLNLKHIKKSLLSYLGRAFLL